MRTRKRPFATVCLTTLVLACGSGAQAQTFKAVTDTKSPDGIDYAFRTVVGAKQLAIAVQWPVDAANAPTGQEGLPSLATRLLFFGGSNGRSWGGLKSEFKDLDATFRIQARPDTVRLIFVAPTDSARDAAALANIVLMKPDFDEEWLARIKTSYLRALKQSRQFAGTKLGLATQRYVLGDHLYGRISPFVDSGMISNVKRTAIVEWHRNTFVRQDMKVTVAGAGGPSEAGPIIDALFKGLPAAPTKPLRTSPMPKLHYDGKTILIADPTAKKSIIFMFGEIKRFNSVTSARSKIALDFLGRESQSRLHKALRSNLGLSYGVSLRTTTIQKRIKVFAITTQVETAKVGLAVESMQDAYKSFVRDGVTQMELDATRDRALQSLERLAKSPLAVAGLTQEIRGFGYPDDYAQRIPAYLKSTTLKDMNPHIASVLPKRSETLTMIITSNPKGIVADCVVQSHREIGRCTEKRNDNRT